MNDDTGTSDSDLEVLLLIGLDGQPFLEARVPRIDRQFLSAMHTAENTTVQQGSWRGELQLLLSRRAPTARLVPDGHHQLAPPDPNDGEAIRSAVIHALNEGFVGGFSLDIRGAVNGYLATPDPIASTVDLEALRADYRAWFAAAGLLETTPEWADATVAQLVDFAIEDLGEKTYSELLFAIDTLSTLQVDTSIVHGVVTGTDPARCCAFLLNHLTGDDRWWRSLR